MNFKLLWSIGSIYVVLLLHFGGATSKEAGSLQYLSSLLRKYEFRNSTAVAAERLNEPVYDGKTASDIAEQLLLSLPNGISDVCANQSQFLLQNLGTLWALQMLDSFGKPESGLLEGNFNWLGEFDECRNAHTDENSPVSFAGQYCRLAVPFDLAGQAQALQVGACVPSGCNSKDTLTLVNSVLLLLGRNATRLTADCHTTDRPFTGGAIVAIVVCSLFAILLAIGTLYEIGRNIRVRAVVTSDKDCERIAEYNVSGYSLDTSRTSLAASDANTQKYNDVSPGLGSKLLLSFSAYTNGQKLLSTASNESALGCLHGIRFLSMCWVILGHTYVFSANILGNGGEFIGQIIIRKSFQVLINATVSVDSFFLLSGLLVAYIMLTELKKKSGQLSVKEWVLIYIHRYIRLTMVYAVLLLIWACLADHFYDGPSWPTSGSLDPACSTYWWTNLLYINNLVPSTGLECMGWTWYLANDMQFFLITPILSYLLYRIWYVGIGATAVLITASIVVTSVVSVNNSYQIGFLGSTDPNWFYNLYTAPWCRFQAYGVGILLGYALYVTKRKVSLPVPVVIVGWLVAATSCLCVIYAPYEAEFGSRAATVMASESAAYNGLSRTAWSIGLAWLIFACCTGYGGWLNTLLSWKAFIPLSRLTYCAYLIHPILLTVAGLGSRYTIHFDDVTMTLRFLGALVISMAMAFVASVAIEAPMMAAEKLLLQPKK